MHFWLSDWSLWCLCRIKFSTHLHQPCSFTFHVFHFLLIRSVLDLASTSSILFAAPCSFLFGYNNYNKNGKIEREELNKCEFDFWFRPELGENSELFGLLTGFAGLSTLFFFLIRTFNFAAEAKRSYIFLRFEAENVPKMFLIWGLQLKAGRKKVNYFITL